MKLPQYPPLPSDFAAVSTGVVDLCGPWRYAQPIPDEAATRPVPEGQTLNVPGEVVMQGLPYEAGKAVVLEREIAVPADWSGMALRIRFEAVYSSCTLFVDGARVDAHLGGFTPFDLDITQHLHPGRTARLTLHVENDSVADLIGFGSRYADHPLIGIPRKAFLYALPRPHLLDLAVATLFEEGNYSRARLRVTIAASERGPATVRLLGPDGGECLCETRDIGAAATLDFDIEDPVLWDTETPALYTLALDFGGVRYARQVGFREVAVRNRKLTLNGRAILLRGVNHHETHPLTGRADTGKWGETDVRLFREAHVNCLRTSHYPPTVELVEACDRAGMLLEVEAPVCFAFGQFGYMPEWADLRQDSQAMMSEYIETASLEMVAFYRSHPSVVIWSVANESHWVPAFARSAAAIRAADPTRPLTYNWWKLDPECRDHVEIANSHYPDAGKVAEFAAEPRPILFDEFAHLFCYNDRELATDPGLRHLWGGFLARQWDEIVALENGAGGAIWAAIDDWFAVPQPDGGHAWRGYGEWGPIDGWRRKKPEYEELRRAFDPAHVRLPALVAGQPATVEIENRFDRADLSELEVTWRLGDRTGGARLAGGPGSCAGFDIPAARAGEQIEIMLALPRLNYRRHVVEQVLKSEKARSQDRHPARLDDAGGRVGPWRIAAGEAGLTLAHDDGLSATLMAALLPRQISRLQGVKTESPAPLGNTAAAIAFDTLEISDGALVFTGRSELANVTFRLQGATEGAGEGIAIAYEILLQQPFEPFQTGIELSLPSDLTRLEWDSGGRRSDYPQDHPARGSGQADARRGANWPAQGDHPLQPAWPWALDETSQGTNDFRSTKRDITRTALLNEAGRGVEVRPEDRADVRAQCREGGVSLFLFDFSSHGSERFLESFAPQVTLDQGDTISGGAVLSLLNGKE